MIDNLVGQLRQGFQGRKNELELKLNGLHLIFFVKKLKTGRLLFPIPLINSFGYFFIITLD